MKTAVLFCLSTGLFALVAISVSNLYKATVNLTLDILLEDLKRKLQRIIYLLRLTNRREQFSNSSFHSCVGQKHKE